MYMYTCNYVFIYIYIYIYTHNIVIHTTDNSGSERLPDELRRPVPSPRGPEPWQLQHI